MRIFKCDDFIIYHIFCESLEAENTCQGAKKEEEERISLARNTMTNLEKAWLLSLLSFCSLHAKLLDGKLRGAYGYSVEIPKMANIIHVIQSDCISNRRTFNRISNIKIKCVSSRRKYIEHSTSSLLMICSHQANAIQRTQRWTKTQRITI